MKKFIIKLIAFFSIILVIYVLVLSLPATPKSRDYYLFSKPEKDRLLKESKSPRIILVGGSNIVFGLDSELIKDSLDLNPINYGLTATVGLFYMMDNVLPMVRKGDIIVVAPEYNHFVGNFAYGGIDLMRTIVDIDFKSKKYLKGRQWFNVIRKSPDLFISKLNPLEYFSYEINPTYSRDIFDEYGDSNAHWDKVKVKFDPIKIKSTDLNGALFNELEQFEKNIESKGAKLYISYPCFGSKSFELNREVIERIESEIINRNFDILGKAELFKMDDKVMFDTPYHLTRKGVERRTILLIEFLKDHN